MRETVATIRPEDTSEWPFVVTSGSQTGPHTSGCCCTQTESCSQRHLQKFLVQIKGPADLWVGVGMGVRVFPANRAQ
jgi:hypothetical protein